MFILFAIALTFFTVSRIQLQTSTNVSNTMRAELLGEAATALAINMLKKDAVEHPAVTSTDHAWTTYFNGLWAAEKDWTRLGQPSIANGGIPIVFYDTRTYENPRTGVTYYDVPGVGRGGELMPHLYVPRFEYPKTGNPTGFILNPETDYDPGANRFVFDPMRENLTYAQRVDAYSDVDNDGDGYRDSIWVPLAQDYLFVRPVGDESSLPVDVDFNLDGKAGQDRPAILFYPGAYDARNGGDAWFLTAPLEMPNPDYTAPDLFLPVILYNLRIPLPSTTYTASTAEVVQGDVVGNRFLVDSIDNDYDGIVNYHVEYYAYWRDRTDPIVREVTTEDRRRRIVTEAEFGRLIALGFTEIDPGYLAPDGRPLYRICTTGEPMCELVGRAAILIRDEAAKVNMNAAGAHYVDTPTLIAFQDNDSDLWPAGLALSTTTSVFTPFWRPAFSSGASTGEYLTWVLPRVSEGRSLEFWNLLTGAPNGSMRSTDFSGFIPAEFVYDVTLPGYGFVDDNANALLLAINGIDDNGNGLVDEGTNLGLNLTPGQIDAAWAYANRARWFPETDPPYSPPLALAINPNQSAADIAQSVYGVFITFGILEGIDEPAEFQFNNPVRNKIAETIPNAPLGTYGDRPLPTREYLKRAVLNEEIGSGVRGLADGAFNRMRPFITIDSGGRNNRTRQDADGNVETLGPKLNYNLASAAQMATAFIKDWKLDEALVYDKDVDPYQQLGYRYLPEDVNRYLSGDMSTDETDVFPLNAFLAGMRIEGVNQAGATLEIGDSTRSLTMLPDPRLRAMQLAVNIADAADADHARTELSTADLQEFEFDPWWYTLQVANGTPPEEAKRPISYTVAGAEAIRINEIMVRPVRRVEAESLATGTDGTVLPAYNPNLAFGRPAFSLERRQFEDGTIDVGGTIYTVVVTAPATPAWTLEPEASSGTPGVIGSNAALSTAVDLVALTIDDGDVGTPPLMISPPNVMEFRFLPSQQLPPGRYYLTINTVDPVAGLPTLQKGEEDKLHYLVKYVREAGSTSDTLSVRPISSFSNTLENISVDTLGNWIINDILADEITAASPSRLDWFSNDAVLGHENEKNKDSLPSGLIFLSGESDVDDTDFPDDTSGPDPRRGYVRGFQAHTVTIPHYEADAEQAYLHVAVYCDDGIALPDFAVNFFEFSQEPDHEWVEIENVSGQPVDLSGWQLTVGAPDPEGNVSTEDKVEMEVPAGTVIDSMPPYNRLLLAVSADSPPVPDPTVDARFGVLFDSNPFLWNGIGQVGTPGYPVYPFADDDTIFFDAGDTTVPLIPARLATEPGADGRGAVDPALPPSPFEASDAPKRIVQLKVRGLHDSSVTDTKQFIADWVLGGGVFPNYPEHDGMDNDYDDHLIGLNNPPDILGRDGIDHNGDENATGAGEGVDEGRLWMDSPVQAHAGAGSFNIMPFALLYDLMPSLYSADPFLTPLTPEWKEFIERRFSPGDNVFVSLYQGAHQQKRVVDRITYTERDVINRSIDEGVDADGNPISTIVDGVAVRPSLHDQSGALTEAYDTFWPDNTMGLDFYRSLERKYHPLYNGDRFGTRNRWQATDGNYDDWSHEPVIEAAKWNASPLDRNDAAFSLDRVDLLQQLAFVDVRNKPFDSLGDLLSLEYSTLDKGYATYGAVPLSANVLAGFQPAADLQALMEAGVTDAIYLSPGAGAYRSLIPSAPTAAQLACTFTQPCGITQYALPQAWRPFYLYEIATAADAELGPPGLPADGNYWLFNGPGQQRAAGLEDPEVLRTRWPLEKRAALLASRNLGTNANATVFVEWDASSGLQDGTYDLYVDTGLKLLDVLPGTLTATGQFIQCRVMENVTERPAVNIALYTDADGDGLITTTSQDLNSKDSLGKLTLLRPDSRGYIYCGSVGVNNNRLAVEVENAVQPPAPGVSADTLNTFAGVILTPRARTQGRINVNTVETRLYKDYDQDGNDITRRLNLLAGIPGVFEDYPMSFAGEQAYRFSVVADVAATGDGPYEFGVIFRCTGDSYYLLRVERIMLEPTVPTTMTNATLYRVVDGVMQPLAGNVFTDEDQFTVSVGVENNALYAPSSTLIGCSVNGAPVADGWEDSFYPLLAGTVGLISATPDVGFLSPSFSPVGAVPFSRGWSGIDWIIGPTVPGGPDLYHYNSGSTSTLFTGYGATDQLDNDSYTTPPQVIPPETVQRPPFIRAEWLAGSRSFVNRAEHWDGRYFESVADLVGPYPDRDPQDPQDDNLSFWPLAEGYGYGGSYPDYLATQAMQESVWRLSRSANLLTTRSDIFEILVTVQAGSGEDLDGDGVINYRSPEEFTVTSERKTRTVYERR